jgi:hypothetical protein
MVAAAAEASRAKLQQELMSAQQRIGGTEKARLELEARRSHLPKQALAPHASWHLIRCCPASLAQHCQQGGDERPYRSFCTQMDARLAS